MSTTSKILIGLAIAVVAGVGYYGLSPLFRNIQADDPLPPGATNGAPMSTTTPSAAETSRMIGALPAPITDTFAHPASGTVRIVEADGTRYVRYENFKTINGPDIFVYLATDTDAREFVNLGAVRATEGNINYEIPLDTDLAKYHYVLTWCRQFSVLFNSADLAAL